MDGFLLEARGVAKRFGSVQALRHVDFRVGRAEVVGLLGDNGAGKSTLIKILNGVHQPDAGEILWEGRPIHFRSPREAQEHGISVVYQDLAVVDLMNIHRNIFLGREDEVCVRFGPIRVLRPARAKARAEQVLREIGIQVRDTDEPVMNLSGGERQSIAIARAVHFSAKLLIMDEPTSQLSLKETAKVLRDIEEARDRGVSVVFITHNVRHVYPIADRFTVLSHGESIGEFRRGEVSEEEIADLIVRGKDASVLRRGGGA
ncbi:MAG TPA: ATP-binding cassette domain-containing protein [Actinomycetota bacterium]|nr:ATP-binding cassette domain-containing protein [Actinomycetota bacterium]